MPINAMATNWLYSSGTYSQTGQIDVWPPQWTHGFITLSKCVDFARAGFRWYRYRTETDQELEEVLSKKWSGMAPTEFVHDKVTSVAFEVWTYQGFGYATIVLTFW